MNVIDKEERQKGWAALKWYIEKGTAELVNTGLTPKDFEHYVFELAMEAVYGPDFWPEWNRLSKDDER